MIPILYLDEDVVAADKPAGVPSIPAGSDPGLPARLADQVPGRLYPVHRLDKDVSGVILFARSPDAHRYLNGQFEGRRVRKTYLALVLGVVKPDRGTVEAPLRQFGSGRMGVATEKGADAETSFEVEERLRGATLLRVRPVTGRRHQIRVHLYSLGHPIVGDRLYGDRAAQKAYPRLMLHALEIALRLPSGRDETIASPVPESFRAVVASFR